MMLVSVDKAKSRLRIDEPDGDADLELMIAGASQAVFRYLKKGVALFTNADGSLELDDDGVVKGVPADVVNATLLLVGIWFRDPDGTESEKWEQGYLPRPVTALLYPLRDPALA